MILVNLQLLAHKKGVGSTRNGRDSESKRLGARKATGRPLQQAISWSASVEPRFIRVRTSASVPMTPCSP